MNDKNYIISIGRQLGSGGRCIGQHLAKELNIEYYDKKLIATAAKESGLCPNVFERKDERKSFFRTGINSFLSLTGYPNEFYSNKISDESIFKIQSEVIQKIANKKSAVIIGRCTDYILRNHPRCISIFISADEKDRIDYIEQKMKLSKELAKKKIEEVDRQRSEYYRYFTSNHWGNSINYDLCVNSSKFGKNETSAFLKEYIEKRIKNL